MCGVKIAGENKFRITPKPGGHFTYANFTYKSVYGDISSNWSKNADGTYSNEIIVPPNAAAEVVLEDDKVIMLTAGRHKFCNIYKDHPK